MRNDVGIIIPTYNQPGHLAVTLSSVLQWTKSIFNIYVVDNSESGYAHGIAQQISDRITVLRPGGNLGWMGGINHGIRNSSESFVLMLNDDIKILDYDHTWLNTLLETFNKVPRLGAVGPSSNMVMGYQHFLNNNHGNRAPNVYNYTLPIMTTTALSGFCLLTPRSVLDEVGLLDESLPGGDDLDYSIRLRNAGYRLAIRKNAFVYHFGSKTGISMYGDHWNSQSYSDAVNNALIKKHGFEAWHTAVQFFDDDAELPPFENWETAEVLKFTNGKGADIGCGAYKICPEAIGVDVTPGGQRGNAGSQAGLISQAEVTIEDIVTPFADGELDYVCARHVLEHIVNPLAALKEWTRILKNGGRLIISEPDEHVIDGIPLDPSHKHAMTVEFLMDMLNTICKFDVISLRKEHISFVVVLRMYK